MPRWEHGSEDRLQKAAIELFKERGFENTSVIEIAERGGERLAESLAGYHVLAFAVLMLVQAAPLLKVRNSL